jgi:hypothetical protein
MQDYTVALAHPLGEKWVGRTTLCLKYIYNFIILFYIYFKILNNILLFYIEWDTWADLWLLDENEWPRFQKKKKKIHWQFSYYYRGSQSITYNPYPTLLCQIVLQHHSLFFF